MKKFILNAIITLIFLALGILFIYLNFTKWIPFENYLENNFALAINFIWAYASLFIGIIFIGVGIVNNYIFIAFIRSLGLEI